MKCAFDPEVKYRVGDVVQIKSKEEIYRDILDITFGFTGPMHKFCDGIFVIKEIVPFSGTFRYYFENMSEEMSNWKWSADMFYYAPSEPDEQEVFVLLK